MKLFVIAGSYQQFMSFIKELGTNASQYTYLHRPDQIAGMRGSLYTLYGEYWLNPLYDKAPELLRAYGLKQIEFVREQPMNNTQAKGAGDE